METTKAKKHHKEELKLVTPLEHCALKKEHGFLVAHVKGASRDMSDVLVKKAREQRAGRLHRSGMKETLDVLSVPGMKQALLKSKKSPLSSYSKKRP